MLGGALNRHQQRQQTLAVLCPGVLLQGFAERQMLRLGLGRKPCRVGRKKRERRLLVLPVFRKVEMHPSDQVPSRMTALEKLLDGKSGVIEFGVASRVD